MLAYAAPTRLWTRGLGLQAAVAHERELASRVEARTPVREDRGIAVFVVAVTVLLALAAVISLAVFIFCLSKGYRGVSGYFKSSGSWWKPWTIKYTIYCWK